jgi:UDP-N-acetylglucosamine 1-carboxyvinyltransferase
MSEYLIIKGGRKLKGSVTPVPNKNSILPALCASVLTNEIVTYKNVPKTTDVIKILEILKLLGADVNDKDFNNLKICCKNIKNYKVDRNLGTLIRASIMLVGPLLKRLGVAEIPLPGGCVLGKRSISSHIDAFIKAGVKITNLKNNYVRFESPKTIKEMYSIWMNEASVTATENILMYVSGINSTVTIVDAACEPHVVEVCKMMESMGAVISGIGSNKLIIKGKSKLKGCVFKPEPDFVDIGGFIVAAALTKGKITIKGANKPEIIGGIVESYRKFNIDIKGEGKDLVVDGRNRIKVDLKTSGLPLTEGNIPKFIPRPWPGFPVDLLPVVVSLCCKNEGKVLIQNWMYETGLDFTKVLNKIGAKIKILNSQTIIVTGPVNFKGGNAVSPDIIQACKALFLASLADKTTTTLYGVDILKRRYPDIINVYRKLGAYIRVIKEN